ncbi:hypothetical protein [Streptomyces sp. 3N207]|uniref:hypothetical protein n=1 Tax=Streptomyces sp. 3N207 TaxID=3457417 RepID=UPI003FD47A00
MILRVTLRRPASLACAVALIALTAACSSNDKDQDSENSKESAAQHAAEGVVSTETAARQLDRYVAVNNRANKTQNGKLLSTVEGGALLEQSKADYKQFTLASAKEKKEYSEPFYYVDRQYYIPRKGTASWFAVSARTKDDGEKSKNPTLLVFDREEGEPWKIVASLQVPKDRALNPARDKHGFLQTVPESAKQGSAQPPTSSSTRSRSCTRSPMCPLPGSSRTRWPVTCTRQPGKPQPL